MTEQMGPWWVWFNVLTTQQRRQAVQELERIIIKCDGYAALMEV